MVKGIRNCGYTTSEVTCEEFVKICKFVEQNGARDVDLYSYHAILLVTNTQRGIRFRVSNQLLETIELEKL